MELEQKHQQLQASYSTLEGLVHALQQGSPAEAGAILTLIRQSGDVDSVVRHVRDGDLRFQLRTVPETNFRYTFPSAREIPDYLKASIGLLDSAAGQTYLTSPDNTNQQGAASQWGGPEYWKPYAAARIADPRLGKVKPSAWTSVSSDDDLLRTLLHCYFLFEYPWFCCFHKDHFLDDMLSGSTNYCSSLLVNSVFAVACVRSPGSSEPLRCFKK